MKRSRLTFALGLIALARDGLALLRHLVLGTEPAWMERVRDMVDPVHAGWGGEP
jgi:hypothetical protein